MSAPAYRGRIAPTPTGFLHLGHARTFWMAQERAAEHRGAVILRNEDLDRQRCQPQYVEAMFEDLSWFGFSWSEGPDVGGPVGPYDQSARPGFYRRTWRNLRETGAVYPSPHSRKDVQNALQAPHEGEWEVIFPRKLRPPDGSERDHPDPGSVNWRFRVPDGEEITFTDGREGPVTFTAGIDFGDFLVWRKDGVPSYEFAVTVDDHAMGITEVVRGADLLISTARQLLIYRAMHWTPPAFYHCPLMRDADGKRLAKRHRSLSLRTLRESGKTPEVLREGWEAS